MTNKSILIAFIISIITDIIWKTIEFIEFGAIQTDRPCDYVVFFIYFVALAIGFSKW